MMLGRIVDLNAVIALSAGKLSFELKLPMADSIISATARAYDAVLWSQDGDFKDIPRAQYVEKK